MSKSKFQTNAKAQNLNQAILVKTRTPPTTSIYNQVFFTWINLTFGIWISFDIWALAFELKSPQVCVFLSSLRENYSFFRWGEGGLFSDAELTEYLIEDRLGGRLTDNLTEGLEAALEVQGDDIPGTALFDILHCTVEKPLSVGQGVFVS